MNAPVSFEKLTPLMCAVKAEQTEAVKLLLAAGANPSQVDIRHKSALIYAIERHSLPIIAALIDAGAALAPQWIVIGAVASPLTYALSLSYYDIAELLLKRGAPATPSLLAGAAGLGAEQVRFLLDAGADPAGMYISKLHFLNLMSPHSLKPSDWLTVLELFLTHGWDLNQPYSSADDTLFTSFVRFSLPYMPEERAVASLRLMLLYGADWKVLSPELRKKMFARMGLSATATEEDVRQWARSDCLIKIR